MKRSLALLLGLLILCCAACGAQEAPAATETPVVAEAPAETERPIPVLAVNYAVERNTGRNAVNYPFVIHTRSADWFVSARDMDLIGEEAYLQGLEKLLRNQDADFADARAVLAPYIHEDVPPVQICTDFCGFAEGSEMFGAYYSSSRNDIRLYRDWDQAGYSLLHEYVHYLTFTCTDHPATTGFFAEGAAEYVSRIACTNRMWRATMPEYSAEEIAIAKQYGIWDEESDAMDPVRFYLFLAEQMRSPEVIGMEYWTITSAPMIRTQEVHDNPTATTLSYYEAGSMTAYLIETYGEEQMLGHLDTYAGSVGELFGKPFPELYRDWAAWSAEKVGPLPGAEGD